jgi:hypothetical protein
VEAFRPVHAAPSGRVARRECSAGWGISLRSDLLASNARRPVPRPLFEMLSWSNDMSTGAMRMSRYRFAANDGYGVEN